jgi:hypothetical protein
MASTRSIHEKIALAQNSPSFEREYNLKYLGKVGNVFHTLDIEAAICTQEVGQEMMHLLSEKMNVAFICE